jgi:hypothetical protein
VTTRKKPHASLSINGLDKTEQEIMSLAYDKLKTALTNIQPWPDTEETPDKLQTEADEMAGDAWNDSCIALNVSVDPSSKALKMVCFIYFSLQLLVIPGLTDQGTHISISWNTQNHGCQLCS